MPLCAEAQGWTSKLGEHPRYALTAGEGALAEGSACQGSQELGSWGSLWFSVPCIVGKVLRSQQPQLYLHGCDSCQWLASKSSACPRQALIAHRLQALPLVFCTCAWCPCSPFWDLFLAVHPSLESCCKPDVLLGSSMVVYSPCTNLGGGMLQFPSSVLSLDFRKILTLQQGIDAEM